MCRTNLLFLIITSLIIGCSALAHKSHYMDSLNTEDLQESSFKAKPAEAQEPKETLVFSDDFDTFDFSKWRHDLTLGGGGNWEFELYWNNRSNSYVKNSILYIKPTLYSDTIGEANIMNGYTADFWGGSPADMCTGNSFYGCLRTSGGGGNYLNPIASAKLTSVNSFSLKYGRVEIRAKLPKGDWIWPALWMLPRYNEYGQWPASGEIDIMESRGNMNYPAGGVDTMSSTLHWGPDWSQNKYSLTHAEYKLPSGTFNDGFHVFGLYWDSTTLYTYLDNPSNKILTVDLVNPDFWSRGKFPPSYNNPWTSGGKNAPFDREMYLIFNLAVGGTNGYFPDGVGNKPWSNTSPHAVNEFFNSVRVWYPTWVGENAALQIDWVKVYSLNGVTNDK